MGREKSRMKGLYMLWNMVDGREKQSYIRFTRR